MGALVENPSVRMMHILAKHPSKEDSLEVRSWHLRSGVQIQELAYKQDGSLSKCQLELLVKQEHIHHFRRAMGTSTAEEKMPYTILLLHSTFPVPCILCAVTAQAVPTS